MPVQLLRASMSLVDDICLKSIAVFRYLVVDPQLSATRHQNLKQNKCDPIPYYTYVIWLRQINGKRYAYLLRQEDESSSL